MATSQAQSRRAPSSLADPSGKGSKERRISTRLAHNKDDAGNDPKRMNNNNTTLTRGEKLADNKRKAGSYEEDDGGFQFSRKDTKKPKSSSEQQPIPSPIKSNAPLSPRRGRPPKTKDHKDSRSPATIGESPTLGVVSTKPQRGRPKRVPEESYNEGDRNNRTLNRSEAEQLIPEAKSRHRGRQEKSKETQQNGFISPEQSQIMTTSKIALPFADTPVIRRNKEMREKGASKGQRRSSLGMRGRRASSLIESGASNALPHNEVSTSDFYKHIASDGLSEPRRMKQLLTWCATRAMGQKPSGSKSDDDSARLAARVIQEELLQDLANRSELSDWFSREDSVPEAVIVRKPNPKNVQNIEKIKELEEQIQRLQHERHVLNALLRPPSIPQYKSLQRERLPDEPESGPGLREQQSSSSFPVTPESPSIDISVLDNSQIALLSSLGLDWSSSQHQSQGRKSSQNPLSSTQIYSRLSRISKTLAPMLDSFASGIHDIELYRSAADTVSSTLLRICSQRLEEREAKNALTSSQLEEEEEEGESLGADSADRNKHAHKRQTKTIDKDSRIRLGKKKQREDIGLVLGALSRVERR